MIAKKLDVELCQEILNEIPPELETYDDLIDFLETLAIDYRINSELIYTDYIYNGNNNNYYYYSLNDKYILYLYFRNAQLKYAEIRNKETERKICAKKLDDLKN
jgi:hypothetical protein